MTNCPNCGAPIISSECEYCGTRFFISQNDSLCVSYANLASYQCLTANEVRKLFGLDEIRKRAMIIRR